MVSSALFKSESSGDSQVIWHEGKHVPELDGVRGLAILIVTIYRFAKELPTTDAATWIFANVAVLGMRGVELFFVLSGFLITGILLDSRSSPDYFKSFYVRRSLRIFPLYYVSLFIFLFVVTWFASTSNLFVEARERQLYLWSYLSNLRMSYENSWCFGYLDHFWSLAVEEHFYLLWPFVIYFVAPRKVLKLAIIAAIACGVSRVAFAVLKYDVAVDVLTIFRADALLMGAILALLIRAPLGLSRLRVIAPPAIAACATICLVSASTNRRMLTLPDSFWPLLWFFALVMLLTSVKEAPIARIFQRPFLRDLGKYSYAMYVFQSPLIPITGLLFTPALIDSYLGDNIVSHLFYISIMFALTYGVARFSWVALESHCLKLKKYFPTRTASLKRDGIDNQSPTNGIRSTDG